MGIGFHICICHFVLSIRSYRFLQTKLGTIKLLLGLVTDLFKIVFEIWSQRKYKKKGLCKTVACKGKVSGIFFLRFVEGLWSWLLTFQYL